MARIAIVAEQSGENRVAASPLTVSKIRALGYDVVVEAGAGAASSFPDAAYLDAGAEIADRATTWSADVVLKIAPPTEDEIALLRPEATLIGLLSPALRPELLAQPRRTRGHRARHGRRPAHLARPVDGCAELDGEHLGIPRCRRGRPRVRPLLHRAGDRRGQGAARQGAGRRCRRRGPRGDRRRVEPRRDRAGDRPSPRGRRSGALDRRRVPRRDRPRRAEGGLDRRLRQGHERRLRPSRGGDLLRAGRRRRHRHHDRPHPGPGRAAAAHRRRRREHEARQRHRRHGRRAGRQRRGVGRR